MTEPAAPIPVLVLAGGRCSSEFAAAAKLEGPRPNRAQAELGGRSMVERVTAACVEAGLSPVIVVAPEGFPEVAGAGLVEADGTLPENIGAGLKTLPAGTERVLIVTADIPFVTAEAIRDWVQAALAVDADCCYCGIRREDCHAQFPGMRRTFVPLREGRLTGGNVVLQRVEAFPRQAAYLEEAHRRRKNPLFLARMIGTANAIRLAFGRLSVRHVEEAAGRLMGVTCRIVTTRHACLGADVDRPQDLEYARARFGEPDQRVRDGGSEAGPPSGGSA